MKQWDRVEPVTDCTSPDDHSALDVKQISSDIPVRVFCENCGADYQVVVYA